MTQFGVSRSARAPRARVVWIVAMSLCVATLVLCTSCLYGFSGGGGLPKNLRSASVQPFDNQTAVPELQREVLEQLRKGMRDRLNLREATEQKADVLVRGTIVRYEVDLPAGVSADPRQTNSTRRRLQIVIDVEILDQTTGRTLLKRAGLSQEGQYPEGGEASGRKNAIETLVTQLIEGMQSQW